MAVNLIKKYGLMPKMDFQECYSSENSEDLNEILNSKVSIQFSLKIFLTKNHNMI